MTDLSRLDIKYLKGVGPKRAALLATELGISSYYDLLYDFPFRYIDRSQVYTISSLQGDSLPSMQFKGRFISFTTHGEGRKRRLQALFTDGTGTIEMVWFNRVKSLLETYKTGVEYIVFGQPKLFKNTYSIIHPEVDVYKPETAPRGLVGVYNLTEKLRNHYFTSRTLQKLVAAMLQAVDVGSLPDPLPPRLRARRGLLSLGEALRNIHLPASVELMQRAQLRFKYEELFFLELNIIKNVKGRNAKLPGFVFSHIGDCFNGFYERGLRFPLTGAQKRVIKEIRADLGSGRQMNRLLQGDVGSGKTIVAFMTMLIALDNGFQACIMAPT